MLCVAPLGKSRLGNSQRLTGLHRSSADEKTESYVNFGLGKNKRSRDRAEISRWQNFAFRPEECIAESIIYLLWVGS